jgi:uncharacterized protein YjbI with pentapeptide repeats
MLLLLCFVSTLHATGPKPWTWRDGNGLVRTREELEVILRDHKAWIISAGAKGKRAYLRDAKLGGADLFRADLQMANCDNADFENADLREANFDSAWLRRANFFRALSVRVRLTRANLQNATFWHADLREAVLDDADVTKGYFVDADLTRASLWRTKLIETTFGPYSRNDLGISLFLLESNLRPTQGSDTASARLSKALLRDADLTRSVLAGVKLDDAILTNANLRGAILVNTDLSGTDLINADLTGAVYEPTNGSTAIGVAFSNGLGYLEFIGNPTQIYLLRKALSDSGFVHQAKLLTAAIHRHGETTLEQLLFDWTCGWGSDWLMPLKLVLLLFFFCSLVYWVGIHSGKKGELYVVSTGQRIATSGSRVHIRRIRVIRPRRLSAKNRRMLGSQPVTFRKTQLRSYYARLRGETSALGTAILFSLLTVFNIGFHDFNFGRWIRILQPREFDIRPRGWMRTMSGIQSVLGLFLVALSLLSYFGHPFE